MQNNSTDDNRQRIAARFRWLDQVGADAALTPLCFRLAYVISSYVNRDKGYAWPGQERLAADCHTTDRSIRSALADLQKRGHLRVTGKGGRSKASHYFPILHAAETRKETSDLAAVNAEDDFRVLDAIPGSEAHETRKETTLNPEENDLKRGSQLPTIPCKNPIKETFDELESAEFVSWYSQYPKKVARKTAAKVYARVIRNGEASHEQLLQAVLRYSASVSGVEPRFIKQPDGWLNAGRWLDEPASIIPHNSQPQSRGDSALDGMRSYIGEDSQ